MKTAHYVKTSKRQYLIISETLQPIGFEIPVVSKKQARQIAANHGAKCWNF